MPANKWGSGFYDNTVVQEFLVSARLVIHNMVSTWTENVLSRHQTEVPLDL